MKLIKEKKKKWQSKIKRKHWQTKGIVEKRFSLEHLPK